MRKIVLAIVWISFLLLLSFSLHPPTVVLLFLSVWVLIAHLSWFLAVEPLEWYDKSPIVNRSTTPLSLGDGTILTKFPGKTPPPIPNGWFMVVMSKDLQPGQHRIVSFLGKDVVVFRRQDKQVGIIDAAVINGVSLCPLHNQPNCQDTCMVSPQEPLGNRKIMELNQMILVYSHSANLEPTWSPIILPEVDQGIFSYHGRSEHVIRCHTQEIFENGPDTAHLGVVHQTVSPFDIPGSIHHLNANWNTDSHDAHVSQIRVTHTIGLFGTKFEVMNRPVIIRQIGPGLCWLEFDSKWGKWIITQAVTPISEGLTRVHHSVYSNMSRLATKFVFRGVVHQLEQDIPIWNNKIYQHRPCLVKNDGPIQKFRRWYAQFYQ